VLPATDSGVRVCMGRDRDRRGVPLGRSGDVTHATPLHLWPPAPVESPLRGSLLIGLDADETARVVSERAILVPPHARAHPRKYRLSTRLRSLRIEPGQAVCTPEAQAIQATLGSRSCDCEAAAYLTNLAGQASFHGICCLKMVSTSQPGGDCWCPSRSYSGGLDLRGLRSKSWGRAAVLLELPAN
jgi:hypothetical protein